MTQTKSAFQYHYIVFTEVKLQSTALLDFPASIAYRRLDRQKECSIKSNRSDLNYFIIYLKIQISTCKSGFGRCRHPSTVFTPGVTDFLSHLFKLHSRVTVVPSKNKVECQFGTDVPNSNEYESVQSVRAILRHIVTIAGLYIHTHTRLQRSHNTCCTFHKQHAHR